MQIPLSVVACWPAQLETSSAELIQAGLSSSSVYRVASKQTCFALKRWPADAISMERLKAVHCFQSMLSRKLEFIPQLQCVGDGHSTFFADGQAWWELATWMSGVPSGFGELSISQIESLAKTVATLHACARCESVSMIHSPAVVDRLRMIASCRENLAKTHEMLRSASEILRVRAAKSMAFFERDAAKVTFKLQQLMPSVACHWVVRDLQAEHVLWDADVVSGIIDFGAARVDEPLVDLVRLAGTQWPFDRDSRFQLLHRYSAQSGDECDLLRYSILDHASALLAAMQWVQWLLTERRTFKIPLETVLKRWDTILQRLTINEW